MAKAGIPIKPRTPAQLGTTRKNIKPVVAPGIKKQGSKKLKPQKVNNYIMGNKGKSL